MNREDLAINKHQNEILEAVKNNQVIVIEAPTGSGKTTQLPQILFHSGLFSHGMIGVTQPRRIAAYGVSSRICYEMNQELGRLVGYKIRFEDKTSAHTQIKIMTDGILLEELRSDPYLSKYSLIMVDEAHERSLNIDFILGLLKEILKVRPDLKVIVSSATINPLLFSQYFGNAPIISVSTKPYPIDVHYLPLKKKDDYELMQAEIFKIVVDLEEKNIAGDILIFFPGEDSIKDCCQRLEMLSANRNQSIQVIPLYARLAPEEQNKVFNSFPGKRKIVVATNIAETSLTIDGIIHVIDSGFFKINYYNPRTFTSFLELKPISKASCDQRKGRAGRTAPGIVYRLYSEEDYQSREQYTREEIYRTDLSEVVLRMADLGIRDYLDFDFISPPNKGAINSAIETLATIGALDDYNNLTVIGKKMVDFPLVPRLSRILLQTAEVYPEVAHAVLVIISFLSAKSPFLYPPGEEIESRTAQKKLASRGGDFFSWINLYYKFIREKDREAFCKSYYLDIRSMNEIANIHSQLSSMMEERGYTIGTDLDHEKILICVCFGLQQYICNRTTKKGNTYISSTEREIRIHPGSYLFPSPPEWLVGGEIVNTGRTYVRSAAVINENIVKDHFQSIYQLITGKPQPRKALREETTFKQKEPELTRIDVLDKYFDIVKEKNERYAIVPYSIIIQLKSRKEKVLHIDFGNIKAKLFYKETLIVKDRMKSLVQYFDKINLDNGINQKFPKNETFLYPDDWSTLYRSIPLLTVPTATGHKSKKAGFLTLKNLNAVSYEYYLEDDFFVSIEESLNSLEALFGSDVQAWNDKEKKIMESVHHKLSNLAEEMEV